MKDKIIVNKQFKDILNQLEKTDGNFFITGRAGTGKSTLLQLFRQLTKKKLVVLAPTGVAALNVKGQTIHSFFKFRPDIKPDKVRKDSRSAEKLAIYKEVETIIIDEISMVRSDLLDCVDRYMRLHGKDSEKPFGGVQVIFFGDLMQLPPVVTRQEEAAFKILYESPYFFHSDVCQSPSFKLQTIELQKIYRQKDQEFIDLLNKIRNNKATQADFEAINARYSPDLYPDEDEFFIYLTTTNKRADEINKQMLMRLETELHTYDGTATGQVAQSAMRAQPKIEVKRESQVMMLNNDQAKRWVNGSIGRVTDIVSGAGLEADTIVVELSDGKIVEVQPFTWEIINYFYNQETKKVETEVIGSYTQFPLRLAWAVTIHKSQGKTFDNVVIDIGWGTFAHGQLYVALSRCTSLAGIILKQPLNEKHVIFDQRVLEFLKGS